MRLQLALCVLLVAADANAAEPATTPPTPGCHAISRADYDKALAGAKVKSGAKVSNFKYVTRIIYAQGNTADFFTRARNRAHPAYVRRSVTINGSDVAIDTQGYTAGSASVCARWLKGFVSQNAKIKAAIAKAPQ